MQVVENFNDAIENVLPGQIIILLLLLNILQWKGNKVNKVYHNLKVNWAFDIGIIKLVMYQNWEKKLNFFKYEEF